MNYLAHAALAWPDSELLIGSMLGDLVKGPLPASLAAGVRFHRAVDAFTDAHPMFRRSADRLRPTVGRYATVVVDVFYDHLLARDFDRYLACSFAPFLQWVRDTLYSQLSDLEPRMHQAAARMLEHEVLVSYREVAGVRFALARISDRARRPIDLTVAADRLAVDRAAFTSDFEAFYPELQRAAAALRDSGDQKRSPNAIP